MQINTVLITLVQAISMVSAGAKAAGCCKLAKPWTQLAASKVACPSSSADGLTDRLYQCPEHTTVQYVSFDDTPAINSDIATIDVPANNVATSDVYIGLSCGGEDSVGLYCPSSPTFHEVSQDFYHIFGNGAGCKSSPQVFRFKPTQAGLKC